MSVLMMSTAVLGTVAPLVSVIVPVILPTPEVCAQTGSTTQTIRRAAAAANKSGRLRKEGKIMALAPKGSSPIKSDGV